MTHIAFGHTLEDEFFGIYTKHDALNSPRHLFLWGQGEYKSGIKNVFSKALSQGNFRVLPSGLRSDAHKLLRLVRLIIHYKDGDQGGGFNGLVGKIKYDLDISDPLTPEISLFLDELVNDYNEFTTEKLFHPFMSDIIANTICADLFDYLARDALYTGISMTYDSRLMKSFVVHPEEPGSTRYRVALNIVSRRGDKRRDFINDIPSLMSMRRDLALKVYYHKTKAAASTMLATSMKLIGGGPPDIHQENGNSILHYTMGDERLLMWVYENALSRITGATLTERQKYEAAAELIVGLWQRKLYKALMIIPFEQWGQSDPEGKVIADISKQILSLSEEIAQRSGCQRHHILLYVPLLKEKAKEVETWALIHKEGRLVKLGQHPYLADDINLINKGFENLWNLLLFVHPKTIRDAPKCKNIVEVTSELLGKRGIKTVDFESCVRAYDPIENTHPLPFE